jgi:hypothetical protein
MKTMAWTRHQGSVDPPPEHHVLKIGPIHNIKQNISFSYSINIIENQLK